LRSNFAAAKLSASPARVAWQGKHERECRAARAKTVARRPACQRGAEQKNFLFLLEGKVGVRKK